MPWPTTPWWAQRQAPMASPPGLEHKATFAPHAQDPAPAHTPARARAYTQDDGIFRPPALQWGPVAVDSPLGLGTRQPGSSASWWGREGSPHPRACFCMRPPAQPNPTPPVGEQLTAWGLMRAAWRRPAVMVRKGVVRGARRVARGRVCVASDAGAVPLGRGGFLAPEATGLLGGLLGGLFGGGGGLIRGPSTGPNRGSTQGAY